MATKEPVFFISGKHLAGLSAKDRDSLFELLAKLMNVSVKDELKKTS
jgi:hypothetical protein